MPPSSGYCSKIPWSTAISTDSSGYVRYEIQGARTGLSVELGATKITQDASAGTRHLILGPNGRAEHADP